MGAPVIVHGRPGSRPGARCPAWLLLLAAGWGCTSANPPVQDLGEGAPAQPASPPATDIAVFSIYPHLDHVHAGSYVRVTDRPEYDNQPFFLDENRIAFTSLADGGQTEVAIYDFSTDSIQRWTQTPESEYSPRPVPGRDAISAVRVELDGTSQHLVVIPKDVDGQAGPAEHVLPGLADIGYYAWAGPGRVALYRVGEPASLHLADLTAGDVRHVQDAIGPTLQSIPGEDAVSFVDRRDPGRPVLRRLDGRTGEVSDVAPLPSAEAEYAWLSSATVLMADQSTIYRSTGDPEAPWHPILERGALPDEFTRFAVSPSGMRIAVVVTR
jgi:hypothetical protein